MATIDLHIEVSADEFQFLRLEAIRNNTSVTGYVKRLIINNKNEKSPQPPKQPREVRQW